MESDSIFYLCLSNPLYFALYAYRYYKYYKYYSTYKTYN